MTLQAHTELSIPEETVRVARAAYPKGHLYLKLRDVLGSIYQDEAFAHLFPHNGHPAEAPWRLALITVLQFLEDLPDRRAADAVRGRIEWKYALGLELTDPGFDASVLCEFRKRLVEGGSELLLLETLLNLFKAHGWLKGRQKQRTDSTHVLARVRAINRLMCVGEAMRFALNSLATIAPDWLLSHDDPEWMERYGHRIEEGLLPKEQAERLAFAEAIGRDGAILLRAIWQESAPCFLRELPACQLLRQIWVQNYYWDDGQLHWREADNLPAASLFLNSPYDPDARYSKKRTTVWTGYKVHLSETCDETLPHLITHVATTKATKTDEEMTGEIHCELDRLELLPATHVVDTGYVSSEILAVAPQRFGVEILGPALPDSHWQKKLETGFDLSQFQIDWEHKQVTCPAGQVSRSWNTYADARHQPLIEVQFASRDCGRCPWKDRCIRSRVKYAHRSLTLRPQEQHEALQAARSRQQTPEFKRQYALRAGIEATISQGTRVFGLRRSRYIGEAKTHLQHLGIAAAINLVRIGAWLNGEDPAPTRVSAYERLYIAA